MTPDHSTLDLPVVLVDDEESMLFSASTLLEADGISPVVVFQDGRQLLPFLAGHGAALVVLDLVMPNLSGQELLRELHSRYPEIPVVMMTAVMEVDTAVACMKEGAFDYLVKPVEKNRFLSCVRRALEIQSLRAEVGSLKEYLLSDRLHHPEAFSHIVTRSRRMRAIFQYLEAIARSAEPVLIEGETGVGKELLVTALHAIAQSPGRLVAVNVAGLDEIAFSDTLFGHRKGAFTGADRERSGLISEAAGGILFLDEIGDLSLAMQLKLLRVLQERQFYPLGADLPVAAETRFVLATNRDLRGQVERGVFRPDLFYRIAAHHIRLPALRERKEDLPLLVSHFLEEAARAQDKRVPTPPPELFTLLANHPFPGNVRELRAMVHDAVARHEGRVLSLAAFRAVLQPPGDGHGPPPPPAENPFRLFPDPLPTFAATENLLIEEALRRTHNNKAMAANLLGITRQTLARRQREG